MDIYSSIGELRGIGPKSKERLNKCGIFNLLDVLLYIPRDYIFCEIDQKFEKIDENKKNILKCRLKRFKMDIRTKNGKRITDIIFTYSNHIVVARWFNQPYMKRNFAIGKEYNLMGVFQKNNNSLLIVCPVIINNDMASNNIMPVYPLKGEINNKFIEKLVRNVFEHIKIRENIPDEIIKKYSLVSLETAIRNIHFPQSKDLLEKARIRLKFQELFMYSLKLMILKKEYRSNQNGISFNYAKELKSFKQNLPYELTDAQTKVVREVLRDGKKKSTMNRLVQGDVGSGKTIVALIAIFNVVKNGYKCALMAPTAILASQHYSEALKLFKNFGIDVELLCGSTPKKEKDRIKEKLKKEKPFLIVGTHALFQDDVVINKLGLVITDEQHRFGVSQRNELQNKGENADCLVMTATPIPRTLAIFMYSDMDVSIIDELPPGRKKVDTIYVDMKKKYEAYDIALEELSKGRQVYAVCPLIEENEDGNLNSVEKVYDTLKNNEFKKYKIGILHGKMKNEEKNSIIKQFKENKIQVLVSTTVIEVGVNIVNASVMIIFNAERFGLSTLHQLRGRVGRGSDKSYCILIGDAKSDITKRRMKIMTESSDGFYISEQDLKLRGSGEIFGSRQSGDNGFLIADIYNDFNILRCAKKEAYSFAQNSLEENRKLLSETEKILKQTSKYICFN
ncbi:ATP-dependent DNA helicase RecG [Clostridium sp. BJN0001]|uniref:ATP-dependent DNA helicase RecG n=1 Tax=Clostridium sp. BJN0001 TaxID=2930219 RepID=UPI001FD3D2D8|nr:ATP-dependent DNA helicase RecG [Clostridium sp. BJN0001]